MSTAVATAPDTSMAKKASLSAFVGSTIEYYDFAIFGTATALVFNKLFFTGEAATIASFATFGVAYIARPLGAVIFGALGDRIGRRNTLLICLTLMGVATFAIGCLPTIATVGPIAAVLLVACRVLQGFSAGGEQAGSNSLTSEHAPEGKRGLYTSWTMQGVSAGYLLGGAAFIPFVAMGEDAFLSWGWRVPFLLAGPLIAFALWIRAQVKEPEVFVKARAEEQAIPAAAAAIPLVELFTKHWRNVLRVFFCSLYALNGTISGVLAVNYATQQVGINPAALLAIISGTSIVMLLTQPFWAILSDRWGRRPVFIISVLGLAVGFTALFASYWTHNLFLVAAVMVFNAIVGGAGNVVQAPMYTEMFPTRIRYTGVAVSTQLGLVAVGFAPAFLSPLMGKGETGWYLPIAVTAALFAIAAISAWSAKETNKMSMHQLDAQGR